MTELSRMSRSLMHLLEVVREFETQGIELISLRENIDTSSATGRCFLTIMGAMAQMERELKAERTAAGRAAAKARGRTGGRPRTDPDKLEQAQILSESVFKKLAMAHDGGLPLAAWHPENRTRPTSPTKNGR